MRRFLLVCAAHAAACLATVASAQSLYLPRTAADACPGCRVVACGSEAVRPGRGYAGTALLGVPRRAYVVAEIMDAPTFRALARQTRDREQLLAELTTRFRRARLLALDGTLRTIRVLPDPPEVTVEFPARLQQCLADPRKPWGCCAGDCATGECCEKALGSPAITLRWADAWAGETLVLHYGHQHGSTRLVRKGAETTTYWCLTDSLARLR